MWKKCHIGLLKVSYLGHISDGIGMHPDPSKVNSTHQWLTSSIVTEPKQFLCLASYYHHHPLLPLKLKSTQYGLTLSYTHYQH